MTQPNKDNKPDEIGKRYGRLTVLNMAARGNSNELRWNVVCDCGKTLIVSASNLITGHTKSCGCWRKEFKKKHGHNSRETGKSNTYQSWQAMIQRCNNPNNKYYKYYGGRGITVDLSWIGVEGFANFLEDMGKCLEGMTLERIDNDSGYTRKNCKWATRAEQVRNQRIPYNAKPFSNIDTYSEALF